MRNKRVSIIITAIVGIIAVIVAYQVGRRSATVKLDDKGYKVQLEMLADTIKELRCNIVSYKKEVERLDLERESIKDELNKILMDNEKVDFKLANGTWDDNVKFLSDYLSKDSCDRE